MKTIFFLTLTIITPISVPAMVKKSLHDQSEQTKLENQLNIQFRKFQDCQNKINAALELKKLEEIPQLQEQTSAHAHAIQDILFASHQYYLAQLSTSIRTRIISVLHQSDSTVTKNYHEELLYTLTNKVKDAALDKWAKLYDLTCVRNDEPQRYGTMMDDQTVVLPVVGCQSPLTKDDYTRINARRELVGLPPISHS